jgi:hypothetical protein
VQGEIERKENTVFRTMHLSRRALRDGAKKDPPLHVVNLAKSGKACLVKPGVLRTARGHQVIFANQTGDSLRIFFPEGSLFAELRGRVPIVELPAGAQVGPFTVKGERRKTIKKGPKRTNKGPKRKKTNVYPYAVFCAVNEDFAIANSNPEIIIDWQ